MVHRVACLLDLLPCSTLRFDVIDTRIRGLEANASLPSRSDETKSLRGEEHCSPTHKIDRRMRRMELTGLSFQLHLRKPSESFRLAVDFRPTLYEALQLLLNIRTIVNRLVKFESMLARSKHLLQGRIWPRTKGVHHSLCLTE